MLIEGKNAIREALNSGSQITNLYVLDSLQTNSEIVKIKELAQKKVL